MFGWRESYRVEVKEIDAQHQHLFALLKNLHRAALEGLPPWELEPLLAEVVSYTEQHFATEEALMRKYEYPDIAIHKRLHDALLAQANDVHEKAKQSALTMPIITKFLEFWIAHHVSEADRKLGRFLISRRQVRRDRFT
jgi:hemerythrin